MIRIEYYGLPLHKDIIPEEVEYEKDLTPEKIIKDACISKGKNPEMFFDLTYSINGKLKEKDTVLSDGDLVQIFLVSFGG